MIGWTIYEEVGMVSTGPQHTIDMMKYAGVVPNQGALEEIVRAWNLGLISAEDKEFLKKYLRIEDGTPFTT